MRDDIRGCVPVSKVGSILGWQAMAQGTSGRDGVRRGTARRGPGCHYAGRCGDGVVQPEYEECDEGAQNGGSCRQDCKIDIIP
jgi:hypothetical protein